MNIRNLGVASLIVGAISVAGAYALMPVHRACAATHGKISFSEDIAPILKGWCVSCHEPGGPGYNASSVDLRSYAGLMKGTKYGPVVIPKQPDASTLIALIYGRTSKEIQMPFHHKPLPSCLRTNIWTWIFEGAKDD
jgi:hypothetical protein